MTDHAQKDKDWGKTLMFRSVVTPSNDILDLNEDGTYVDIDGPEDGASERVLLNATLQVPNPKFTYISVRLKLTDGGHTAVCTVCTTKDPVKDVEDLKSLPASLEFTQIGTNYDIWKEDCDQENA